MPTTRLLTICLGGGGIHTSGGGGVRGRIHLGCTWGCTHLQPIPWMHPLRSSPCMHLPWCNPWMQSKWMHPLDAPSGYTPPGCNPDGCIHWMYTPCGQTDSCENITFPQLRLREVKTEGTLAHGLYFKNFNESYRAS